MNASQAPKFVKPMSRKKPTELESLIVALDSRLASQEPANRSLVSLLNSLAAHLEMHFELERPEQDLSDIALRDARLAQEVKRLESQRAEILVEAEAMIAMARTAFTRKQSTASLAARYREFQDRFATHELAEKKLIQDVFNADSTLAEP